MSKLPLLLVLALSLRLYGQESLSRQLINTPDEQKIILYNNYVDGLDIGSIEQIYYYSRQALALLEFYPNNLEQARAHSNLSRVGEFLKDDKMSIDHLETAYHLNVDSPSLHASISYRLALLYEKSDLKRSIKLYRESYNSALSQQKKIDALLGETRTFRLDQQYSNALKTIEQILVLNPDEAMAYVEWGQLMLDQNNREAASRYWQRALALASDDNYAAALAHYGLAQLSYDQKKYQEAIFYAEKAVLAASRFQDNPFIIQAQTLLADAFLRGGFTEQAFTILKLKQDRQIKLLEDEQKSISLFFRNSIEISSLIDENALLNKELAARSRLFYLAIVISSALIIALFIMMQLLHTKETGEKVATSAYHTLVSRSKKKRVSMRQRALALWAGNKNFTIYRITIFGEKLSSMQSTLIDDFMAFICQDSIEQLIPSAELFRHYYHANVFFVIVPNQAVEASIIDEILAENKNIETTLLGKKEIITMNIEKFYNDKSIISELEAQLNQWQSNEFY